MSATTSRAPRASVAPARGSAAAEARARSVARDIGALVAIAAAVAWLYWRPLFEAGVWFPANGGDLASLIYPNYRFAAESLRAGDLPLWNPYIQSGAPFAADIQSGLLYPVNLLVFYLLPRIGYRAVEGLALFHVWLAGALAYACARGLGQHRAGALIAGIAYALSDYFVVHVGNLNLMAVAAWLPLILLAAQRVGCDPSARWIGIGALAIAMAALAGHAQPLLYGFAIVAIVGAAHLWRILAGTSDVSVGAVGNGREIGSFDGASRHERSRSGADRSGATPRWTALLKRRRGVLTARMVGALGATVALGMLGAAVQLIPAAEMTSLSVRAAIPYETSTEYSLAPEQLISLIVPGFFGRGPDAYWSQWLRTEAGYAGVLTLLLAGIAIVLRRAAPPSLLAVGGGGLLLALGGYTALHALVYRFVPLFGSLRAPARAIVVFDLGLCLLAGAGLTALLVALERQEGWRLTRVLRGYGAALRYAVALLPLGLVMLMLLRENPMLPRATGIVEGWAMFVLWLGGALALIHGWRSGRLGAAAFAALAVGWLALDLVSNAQGLELTRKNPELGFERPAVVDFLRADPEPFRIDTDTGVWDVWQPNTAMVQRLPDVVGGLHPLELSDFRRYWSGLGSRSTPLYDLFNARYLIGKKNVPLDRAKFELAFDGDPELSVFRNTRALPRAFLVGGAVAAPSHDRAYELIHDPAFDPRAYAVVEGASDLAPRGSAGSARLVDYRSSALSVDIEPTQPGLLVLSEVWYPGWSATVDGRPAPVLRANYLFRAVAVAPGDRRVELRFEPTRWRLALGLTALGWLGIGLLLVWPTTLARWTGSTRRAPGSPSAS